MGSSSQSTAREHVAAPEVQSAEREAGGEVPARGSGEEPALHAAHLDADYVSVGDRRGI